MKIEERPPKARSVTEQGEPDGFAPSCFFRSRVLQGGYTRLEVSASSDKMKIIHRALVEALSFPCKLRYLKMTDRQRGQLEKPESFVAVDISKDRMMMALEDYAELFYFDARHQLWILGANEEQIVLDELGMLYIYPDDFLFRDILLKLGWPELNRESMADRDYVQVYFSSDADGQEQSLMQSFGLVRWEG